MKTHNINELLQILEAMRQAELAMSVLYKICAKKWGEDSEFWLNLSKDEIHHSENVKMLSIIIQEKIGTQVNFQPFRPFTLNSVQSFISGTMDSAERVRHDKISKKSALAIALDVERSAIERKYAELVKTDDIEYKTISTSIDNETQIHRDKIEKKLAEQTK